MAYRNRAVRPRPRKVLLLISPFSTSGCTANTMVNAGWMMLSLALPILSTRMVSPLWPLRNTSIFTLRLYRPLMISKIPPSAETTAAQPLFSARTDVSFSEVTSSTKSRSGFTGSYSAISLALFLISSSVALPLDARSTRLRFSFSSLLSSIWLLTISGLRRSFSVFSYTSTGRIIMDSTEDFRSAGSMMTTI